VLTAPQALLLDFGGVIVDGPTSENWEYDLACVVVELLKSSDLEPVSTGMIVDALRDSDRAADACWLLDAPTQHGTDTFWGDVIGGAWPVAVRNVLVAHASELSLRLAEIKFASAWRSRPGIAEVLATAERAGLPLAVVSNTICGAAHREYLRKAGFAAYFQIQLYSDEEGVRKPNPELVFRATTALGVPPADCWFIGDTLSRDILVARRAGIGTAVLMRSARIEPLPLPDGVVPDAVVADPVELDALLGRHVS
jgi:HAD superfamily hydrolase (TIGR01549 family)